MANIFETARAERAYNKYVKGLESMAGLVETLSGPGPFTLFIPTDAAFDRLSDDQQANLFEDPGKLARVLKYHIVPGYYTADDLLDRLFLKTLEGKRLRVWSDVSEVPLGEEEIAIEGDALNYISSDTVTTAVRESITINGVVAVPLIFIIALIARNKNIMGQYTSGWVSNLLVWLTFVGMGAAAVAMFATLGQ